MSMFRDQDCTPSGIDKLYKFLDIPDHHYISNNLLDYYNSITQFKEIRGFTKVVDTVPLLCNIPLLQQTFKQLELKCVYTAFVVVNKFHQALVHKDHGTHRYRLLWPVQNCQNTFVRFFNVGEDKKIWIDGPDNKYHQYDITDATEIGNYELTSPIVADVTIPHYIDVDNLNGDRISFYCMFDKDPVHLIK